MSRRKQTIDEIDTKISQLKAQKQAIVNREKSKREKQRKQRIFKYGELVEKYYGDISPEQLEEILERYSQSQNGGDGG